ncbi:restriction endonuclease, SacI family [Leuconostoc citreum]|uniref:restriction endonuclease, SacI family n=1 Tax=Leuconostoc citreum TaxID=33964 RepID=UPI002073D8DF|nr:restriction endonuclease, SacI family [Leuconostoc citreum]
MKISESEKQEICENLKKALSLSKSQRPISLLTTNQEKMISEVVLGNHKTYKYILLTALATKSVIHNIDILSLQASSDSTGAYDARSIAHSVIVPFERAFLQDSSLGFSNEPFLNKPARFKELNKSNAVRNGGDRHKLESLVNTLPTFHSQSAFDGMVFFFQKLTEQPVDKIPYDDIKKENPLFNFRNFSKDLLSKSYGGESLAFGIGLVLKIFFSCINTDNRVLVHKVNESGSSSLEAGDIDVFSDNTIIGCVEAKDKTFTIQDVEHAAQKAAKSHIYNSSFVYNGPMLPKFSLDDMSKSIWQNQNVHILIVDYDNYYRSILGNINFNTSHVLSSVNELLDSGELSKEFSDYVLTLLGTNDGYFQQNN